MMEKHDVMQNDFSACVGRQITSPGEVHWREQILLSLVAAC